MSLSALEVSLNDSEISLNEVEVSLNALKTGLNGSILSLAEGTQITALSKQSF